MATKKEKGFFKILKETPEQWIKMEVEMDNELQKELLNYADENMKPKDKENFYISWALIDVIKKEVKKEGKKK